MCARSSDVLARSFLGARSPLQNPLMQFKTNRSYLTLRQMNPLSRILKFSVSIAIRHTIFESYLILSKDTKNYSSS
jgi:hypothetical protein